MTRTRLIWRLAAVAMGWLAATLGVLKLGDSTNYASSCPLDGPWG
jgi:hypothetical protein